MVHDRDRLLDSIDLPGLADELLGHHTGSDRSPTWPCPNPNHAQTGRTPPVTIFMSRHGHQRWHCHGCGDGGTAIDLVMAARGCTVRDALDDLAARAGIRPDAEPSTPRVRRRRPARSEPAEVADPEGLAAYVDDCARRLWQPEGRPVLRWLTRTRGLPPDVLEHNRVGADPGADRQRRPRGMPAAGWSAVLPVHDNGRPVFAQLRVLGSGRLRYLNATTDLAPNPRIALYEPVEQRGSCVLVTEGVLDALSATAAGLRGVALFGAAVPDPARPSPTTTDLTERLTKLPGRLVPALDADDAGQLATDRLTELLQPTQCHVTRLAMPDGAKDLNDWLRNDPDFAAHLEHRLREAVERSPPRALAR